MAGSNFTAYLNTRLMTAGAMTDLATLQKYISGTPISIPVSLKTNIQNAAGGLNQGALAAMSKEYQTNLQYITNANMSLNKMQNESDTKRVQSIKALATVQIDTATKSNEALMKAAEFQAKADSYAVGPAKNVALKNARDQIALSEKLSTSLSKNAQELKVQEAALQSGSGAFKSWTSYLGNAIKQTLSYTLTIGLVRGVLQQMQLGIQYITDLNTEMTKIQVLQVPGAMTKSEIDALAVSYNTLADSMGATTLEVVQGSTEWFNFRSL